MNSKKVLIGIIVLLTILTASCKNTSDTNTIEQIRYLALGDSYTIGEGVEEELRWPNQLSEKLKEQDIDVAQTTIIAKTGWTTGELLATIDGENYENYNLVSLLIGVNNQYRGQDFSLFTKELDTLLDKAIGYAGGVDRVFVLSIPDYGVTPFGAAQSEKIAMEIDNYNDYISSRCALKDILFVDITSISRRLGSSDGALAPDQLHPSGQQYSEWVQASLPGVLDLLQD